MCTHSLERRQTSSTDVGMGSSQQLHSVKASTPPVLVRSTYRSLACGYSINFEMDT